MSFLDRFRTKKAAPPPPTITPEAVDAAHALVEQLRLLHPTFGRIELVAELSDGMYIHEARVSDPRGVWPAALFVDAPIQTALAAGALAHLWHTLDAPTDGKQVFNVFIAPASVTLLGATIGIDAGRLAYGPAFFEHLSRIDGAIKPRCRSHQTHCRPARDRYGPVARSTQLFPHSAVRLHHRLSGRRSARPARRLAPTVSRRSGAVLRHGAQGRMGITPYRLTSRRPTAG